MTIILEINNVAIDNALHFGGIQDEINLTYISETGAFPSHLYVWF